MATQKKKWKKIGAGSFELRVPGKAPRIIKENEIFFEFEEYIPLGFRDLIIEQDATPVPEEDGKPIRVRTNTPTKLQLGLKKVKGGFHVINITTKAVLTENPLPEEEAEEVRQQLLKG